MFQALPTLRLFSTVFVAATFVLAVHPSRAADEASLGVAQDETKQQILQSDSWQKTMRDLNQWFSVQLIYNKDQVAQLRQKARNKIDSMTAEELTEYQRDLQKKLAVLSSPEAVETRAWAQAYLDAASQAKAAEFRRRLPDVARMTADQIEQALQDNQLQRSSAMASRKAFDRARNEQVTSIRQMQQQQAEAATCAHEAASYSTGQGHGGSANQLPPRRYEPYPGMFGGFGGGYGRGWGLWGW